VVLTQESTVEASSPLLQAAAITTPSQGEETVTRYGREERSEERTENEETRERREERYDRRTEREEELSANTVSSDEGRAAADAERGVESIRTPVHPTPAEASMPTSPSVADPLQRMFPEEEEEGSTKDSVRPV